MKFQILSLFFQPLNWNEFQIELREYQKQKKKTKRYSKNILGGYMSQLITEKNIEKLKFYLQQAPYLSTDAVCSLIRERGVGPRTATRIMRRLAQQEPEEYVYVPYIKAPKKQKRMSRIYHREALIEDDVLLEQYVKIIKNRCNGGIL